MLASARTPAYLSGVPRPATDYLPDLLSLSRFPLAAAFAVMDDPTARVALLAGASLTDWLDGFLARRRSRATAWGALLDPIADKTFVLVAFLTMVAAGRLTLGGLLLVLVRDIATVIGFLVAWRSPALRASRFRARFAGKVVTVLQLATLFALILAPRASILFVAATALASVAAIWDYTVALARERAAARSA